MATLRASSLMIVAIIVLSLATASVAHAGQSVTITGTVTVTLAGDAVASITITSAAGIYTVRLDQNARIIASLNGQKVTIQGTLIKKAGKTLLAVISAKKM